MCGITSAEWTSLVGDAPRAAQGTVYPLFHKAGSHSIWYPPGPFSAKLLQHVLVLMVSGFSVASI